MGSSGHVSPGTGDGSSPAKKAHPSRPQPRTVGVSPAQDDADRKQLLRHLIEIVTVTVTGDSEQVNVEVTWAGGNRTECFVTRPVAPWPS